jgi:uncharacterized protein
MPLVFNIRHLEEKSLALSGELPAAELGVNESDELIHVAQPLTHDLEVQKLGENILVQGRISLVLECECARCLKPFQLPLDWTGWVCHLPLIGEEAVDVQNDCVDLTPWIREDILLAFPQHPLCEPDCAGLPASESTGLATKSDPGSVDAVASAWAELNKLKLEE